MASNTTKKQAAAKPEGEKKTRVTLTPAERIAKMEADLAAARERAAAGNAKKAKALVEQRDKLVAKRTEIEEKISGLTAQLDELGYVEPAGTPVDDAEAQPAEG